MVVLTEDMIVARTRVSDMNHVKKLNCWGAELSDISVLRKLSNVEVLSLSVNTITTLEDIQHCKNLQELYIRKNAIPNLTQICWLRDLPRLKNLWLEENPCAAGDPELYRQTVIRNIPQLQKLDNVVITSEEIADAMRRGIDLDHPLDGVSDHQTVRQQDQRQMQRDEQQQDSRRINRSSYHEKSEYEQPQRKESIQSPSRRVSNQVWPVEPSQSYSLSSKHSYSSSSLHSYSPLLSNSYSPQPSHSYSPQPPHCYSPPPPHSNSPPPPPINPPWDEEPESGNHDEYYQRETTPEQGVTRYSSRDDYRYSNHHQQQQQQRHSYSGPPSDTVYRGQEASRPMHEYYGNQAKYSHEAHAIVDQHYQATYRQVDQQLEGAHQLVAQRALSPQRPYPARPKNRNSNVLSAILCLIKEIDGPSLEVVEMAVRCRMEELED